MIVPLAFIAFQLTSCLPVHAEHIYGRDLAAALPELSALAPEKTISLSPVPGQRRVFRAIELNRIARANGLEAALNREVCFEWPRHVPRQDLVLSAMKKSLTGLNATIEVVEPPLNPIPDGKLDFPLSGISGSSDAPIVWRGTVTYAANRTLAIWARARIVVHEKHVVATATLSPSDTIRGTDLRLETYDGPVSSREDLL